MMQVRLRNHVWEKQCAARYVSMIRIRLLPRTRCIIAFRFIFLLLMENADLV